MCKLSVYVPMLVLSFTHIQANPTYNLKPIKNPLVVLQQLAITGKLTNSNGEPITGASILEKGTLNGVVSDIDGKYKIVVSSPEAVLVFSFMGYLKEEKSVGTQTTIDLVMIEDMHNLNEVVVTAMGIKREEKALGYAISTVSSKDLVEAGSTNFASALYGKAAGVRVNSGPGGASSAVNIQIRGVSSIFNNTQPLYVVDGIPVRNHPLLNYKAANNNADYWTESRIRENGILDINPEDIENLTVLKGASASALYGSEAGNGVIVITTKKGSKQSGMGVDFNYLYDVEKLAFQPDYQNDYGPGYGTQIAVHQLGTPADGFLVNSDGTVRPRYSAYAQYGPKFDGRMVRYWDGTMRPYVAQPDNYKDFFQTGFNSTANLAISNGNDKGNYRLSYTRNDYKGIQPGGHLEKNYFNFNGSLILSKLVSVDIVSSYINSFTHNRPTIMTRIFGADAGFFSRMDDMNTYMNKYQTTKGYKWVSLGNSQYDPQEALSFNIAATELMDFLWNQLKNSHDESQDRFVNSATLNVNLTSKLKLRGRMGNDVTSLRIEDKKYSEYPSAFGYTGTYGVQNGKYNLIYGDALLSYTDKITQDISFGLTAGFTAKKDIYTDSNTSTNGGLVTENWFSLNNSANPFTNDQISSNRKNQEYVAEFGTLSVSFKDWLYLEGTGRNEATSTLPPGNNSYFYPSVNGAFIFTEAFKIPSSILNYGKLRASFGIVGNHPDMYDANVAYTQKSISASTGTALYQSANNSKYGNDKIKSEQKNETEFGLETKLLNYRLGVDISYYNNKIQDQIIFRTTPASAGSTSVLSNVGDLTNQGVEIALSATPVQTHTFRWDTRFNFAINRNKVDRLADGVNFLEMYNADGGSLLIRAVVGESIGDIYVHPIATNAKGEKIVNQYGVYDIDDNTYQKVGNVTPKVVGGLANSISFKGFALDFLIDYRIGGQLVSTPMYYMYGAGMFKNTLEYRDAAHGGLSYNDDGHGALSLASNGTYHDGILLPGVDASGNPNKVVVDAPSYYLNSFNWGSGPDNGYNRYESAVFDNSYIKVREVTLSYSLPKKLVTKMGLQKLQVSLIGRNLFYIWKTLPNIDPETSTGSNWLYQGIDQGGSAPIRSLGASVRLSF